MSKLRDAITACKTGQGSVSDTKETICAALHKSGLGSMGDNSIAFLAGNTIISTAYVRKRGRVVTPNDIEFGGEIGQDPIILYI